MHLSQKTVNCADKTSDNLKARTLFFQVSMIYFFRFTILATCQSPGSGQSHHIGSCLPQQSFGHFTTVPTQDHQTLQQTLSGETFSNIQLCMQNNHGFIHKICFYFNIIHKLNMQQAYHGCYVVIDLYFKKKYFEKLSDIFQN